MDSASDGIVPPLIRVTTPTINTTHKSHHSSHSIHIIQSCVDDTGRIIDNNNEELQALLPRQSSDSLGTPPPHLHNKPSITSFEPLSPKQYIHNKNLSNIPPPIPNGLKLSLPTTPLSHRHSPSVPPPLPARLSVSNTPVHTIHTDTKKHSHSNQADKLRVNIEYDHADDELIVHIDMDHTDESSNDHHKLPSTPTSIALLAATQQPLSIDSDTGTQSHDITSTQSDVPTSVKLDKRRGLIINEILTTEKSYVTSLKLLMNIYLQPLNDKSIISKDNIQILNSNLAIISDVNERFLHDLQKTVNDIKQHDNTIQPTDPDQSCSTDTCIMESPSIASLFLKYAPFFKVYTQYVNDQERVITLLQQLDKDNKWNKYIKEQQDGYCTQQHANALSSNNNDTVSNSTVQQLGSIQSYLIMPIQRIPRYKLLLAELQKSTVESSTEYDRLTKSLSLIDSVAIHINEAVRKQQQNMTVIDIQSKFGGSVNFVLPGRTLIKQGQLIKCGKKRDDKYQFFLFSDLLAYASTMITGKYKLHKQFTLHDTHDNKYSVILSCSDMDDDADNKYRFCVNNSVKPLILCAASQQSKIEWLGEINKLLHAAQNSGIIRPIAPVKHNIILLGQIKPNKQQYTIDSKCNVCISKITQLTGKHNCKCCGCVVCSACSVQKVYLDWSKRADRVCDHCFDKLCEVKATTIQRLQRSMTVDSINIHEPRSPLSPHPLLSSTNGIPSVRTSRTLPPPPKHLQQQHNSISVNTNTPSGIICDDAAPLSPPPLLLSPAQSTPSRPTKPAQHTYFQMLSELVTITPRIHAINTKHKTTHNDTKHSYSHTTFIGNEKRLPQKLTFLRQRRQLNIDTSITNNSTSLGHERSPSSLDPYENDSDMDNEMADSSDDDNDTIQSNNTSRRPSVSNVRNTIIIPTNDVNNNNNNNRPNSGKQHTDHSQQNKQIDELIQAMSPVSIAANESPTITVQASSPPPHTHTASSLVLSLPAHRSTQSVLPPPLPTQHKLLLHVDSINNSSGSSVYDMTASMNGKRAGSKVAALTLKLQSQLGNEDSTTQSHQHKQSYHTTSSSRNGLARHQPNQSQSPPPLPHTQPIQIKLSSNNSNHTSPNTDNENIEPAGGNRSRRSTGLLGKFNTLFTKKDKSDTNTLSQPQEVHSSELLALSAPAAVNDTDHNDHRKLMANSLAQALKQRRQSHDNA